MITNYFFMLFGIYLAIFPLFPSIINRKTLFTEFFMILIMIIYIIINLRTDKKRGEFIKNLKEFFMDKVSLTLFILFAYMIISISYSTSIILALKDSMRFAIALGLFFIIRFEIKDRKQLNGLIRFIYVPAFFEFIYGIIQRYTKIGINHTVNVGEIIVRIEGTLGHPNTLAGYAVVLFFPLFFIMLNEKNKKWKMFYILELMLMAINIIFTYSRNAWIALFGGIVILCVYFSWKFLIGLGLAGGIALFIPSIKSRVLQFDDAGLNSGRLKIWTLAIKCFKDHPILGVGAGNYEAVHPSYVEKYPEYNPGEEIYHTHNVYLKMLSELGIIGFLLYIVSAVFILLKTIKVHNKVKKADKYLVGGIFTSFMVSYFIISMFDNLIVLPQIMNYFYLFLGIIYVVERLNKEESI